MPFNVRVHLKAIKAFRKLYAQFYPSKHKYTQGKLAAIAIMLLDKQIKDRKITGDDDIAGKLGL